MQIRYLCMLSELHDLVMHASKQLKSDSLLSVPLQVFNAGRCKA